MRFLKLLLGILAILYLSPNQGFTQTEVVLGCEEKETSIFFINGIATTRNEALRNSRKLEGVLSSKTLTGQLTQEEFDKLEFDIAYNPTGGLLPDVAETIAQDLENSVENVWTVTWKIILSLPVGVGIVTQELRDEILNKIKIATLGLVINEGDLIRHLEKYRKSLLEGKQVLMVSHSQGNFFANAAWDVLAAEAAVPDSPFSTAHFGIVGVATPADRVGGSGLYTTLDQDQVINAVRVATLPPGLLSPLPHTVDLPPELEEILDPPLHHSFIDAYLHPQSPAREIIITHVILALQGLTQPGQILNTGILDVTFSTEEDLALQVREPLGARVYEGNLSGIGSLEVVGLESPLQELIFTWHYSIACADIVPGVYAIDVVDGGRENPPDEVMVIQAGGQEQTFGDIVGEANVSAWAIGEVWVTDPEGEGNIADFMYEIVRVEGSAPPPEDPPPPGI